MTDIDADVIKALTFFQLDISGNVSSGAGYFEILKTVFKMFVVGLL